MAGHGGRQLPPLLQDRQQEVEFSNQATINAFEEMLAIVRILRSGARTSAERVDLAKPRVLAVPASSLPESMRLQWERTQRMYDDWPEPSRRKVVGRRAEVLAERVLEAAVTLSAHIDDGS